MSLEEEETDWVIVFISQQQLSSMLELEQQQEQKYNSTTSYSNKHLYPRSLLYVFIKLY